MQQPKDKIQFRAIFRVKTETHMATIRNWVPNSHSLAPIKMKPTFLLLPILISSIEVFGQYDFLIQRDPISLSEIPRTKEFTSDYAALVNTNVTAKSRAEFDKKINRTPEICNVDLDNDGDMDFVYGGWSGGEHSIVIFYINTNSKFLDATMNGSVTGILTQNEDTRIVVTDPPCCDGITGAIKEITFSKDTCSIKNVYYYVTLNEIPSELTLQKKFETTQQTYNLRYSPDVNNEIKEYPVRTWEGNITAKYAKGSTGIALAKKTDSTGRVWYYSAMTNNNAPTFKQFEIHEDDKNGYFLGWISSRYVNVE